VSAQLILCDECSRHVKVSETTCPFCGARSFRPSVRDPFRHMAVAAAVAAGVTGLTACSSDRSTGAIDHGSATMTFTSTAVSYGLPPSPVGCVYANENYANGATWSCGCNTCSCYDGIVTGATVACDASSDASEPDDGSFGDSADGSLGDSASDASFGDAGNDANAPDGGDE
jgi:hypothetical protein